MAGQVVFIEYIASDAEAHRAAFSIAGTLRDAHWDVQSLIPRDGLADGVSVQPFTPTLLGAANGEMPLSWHINEVAYKLLDFLHSYNWQATRGWPTDKVLPVGTIRIQVGLYPAVVYVSPPGQKELIARMEERQREEEKTEAEAKRRDEESLAQLPPEYRQKIQQMDENWKATVKRERSTGPCQVLNPLF